ncbi:MAG TPA: TonB-dependent receptor [Blastocatellia bacterium]|nr:TonB-dependent receptor [Blastocatellia bacterium]
MLKLFSTCLANGRSSVNSNISINRIARLVLAALAFSCVMNLGSGALADSDRGRVEGTVADREGASIAGARVLLRNAGGLIVYQTRTDDQGRFSFSAVIEGRYDLLVEASGFSQSQKAGVDVRADTTEGVALRLEIAAISDHVIVTATRTPTPASELSGSVSVISSDDIERAGGSLVSEPLRLVPGLVVAQTGGRGGLTSIFVRGGESDYNRVLIDGVPVNAAGGLFDFSALTPENFERIEVARGPRSALFGSDAMSSVIQLVTRRGTTSVPELELSGEGGSFGYQRETARLSGMARWFDYSTSFGHRTERGRFENSDYRNRSASANLGFRLAAGADLRITSRWNNNSLGVSGPVRVLFADPDQRQKHRDFALGAALEHKATSRWNQSVRFVFSEFDTSSFDPLAQDLTRGDRPPVPPGAFGPDFAFSFVEHQKRVGLHYQTTAAVSASNVIAGGVDLERESAVFTDEFSRVAPSRNNLGIYIQDQASLGGRLFVSAGLRIERNTARVPEDLIRTLRVLGSTVPQGNVGFGVSVNPKFALSLLARRHREGTSLGATRFTASYGTGIKEPSLTEAFSPSPFFVGNPGLDPERAVSFDVGAVQEFFGRRASVEVIYYDNRFRDQIIFTFDPLTFGPISLSGGRLTNFINLDRASARGVELVVAANPMRQIRIAAGYTFLRSRLDRASEAAGSEVGLPLLRRPRHATSFDVRWAGERATLTLDGSIVGKRRDLDPVSFARFDASGRPLVNEGYARVNVAGSYRVNRSIRPFARIENILSRDYDEILGFPAHKLTFSIGLRIRIGGAN